MKKWTCTVWNRREGCRPPLTSRRHRWHRPGKRGSIDELGLAVFCGMLLLTGCGSDTAETEPLFATEASENVSENTADAGEEPVIIYLTHSEKENSFTNEAALRFREILEEESDGHFQVTVFPADTLGSVKEADYMLEQNQVQMRIGSGPSELIILLGYPLLTGLGTDELWDIWEDGALNSLFAEEGENCGTRIIGLLPPKYRILSCSRPVRSVEDLKGLKVRTSEYDLTCAYWECEGADVYPMALSEVYLSLQQELVDGNADGTLDSFISNQFYRQQDYVIETEHQIYLEPVYISEDFYQQLTEEEREELLDAIGQTEEEYQKKARKDMEENVEFLESEGITFLTMTDAEKEKMSELAYDTMYSMLCDRAGEDTVKKLQKTLEQWKKSR